MSKNIPAPSQADTRRVKQQWTGEEDRLLRNNYGKISLDELAEKLGRTQHGIYAHARALGLTRKHKSARAGWTDEEVAYLKAHYKTSRKPELCKKLNKGTNSLYFKALELGLIRKMHTIKKDKQARCAIVLDASDKEFAKELGGGSISDGIRIALRESAKRKTA
jgi:hypothetical protein